MTPTILNDKIIDEKFRNLIEEKKEKGELITTIQRNGRYLLEDGCVYSLHIGDEVIGIAQEVNTDPLIEFRESRFGIVELEHQPFNPILDQPLVHNNPNVSYEWHSEMMQEPTLEQQLDQIATNQHNSEYFDFVSTMQNDMETAFGNHKKRKCWVCEKPLNYNEYLERNNDNINIIVDIGKKYIGYNERTEKEKELEKQWKSDNVEIPCCNCFTVLELLQSNKLAVIRYKDTIEKCYSVKTNLLYNIKKVKNIRIVFEDSNEEELISEKAFKNLVEKKFIDIEPSALKELLGGSE